MFCSSSSTRSTRRPIRYDVLDVMLESHPMVAVMKEDYRILVCDLARFKLLDRDRFGMEAPQDRIIVIEEPLKIAGRDSHTTVDLKILCYEQGMMGSLLHLSACKASRGHYCPFRAQALLEKRHSTWVR